MATHPSILAWKIPWTEEPEGLQFMGSQRVGHDRATNSFTVCLMGSVPERFFSNPLQNALVNDTVKVSQTDRRKSADQPPPGRPRRPAYSNLQTPLNSGPGERTTFGWASRLHISIMGSGTLVMQKGWERPPALMLITRSLTLRPVRPQDCASRTPAVTQEAAASLSPASFAGWSCRAMAWRVSFTIWSSPLRDCAHVVKEHA